MERALEQWKSKEVARLLALVETERRYYQEMVANMPVSMAVVNSEGNLVAANRSFRQGYLTQGEEIRKRFVDQIFPSAELQARITSVFESGLASRPIVIDQAGKRLRVSVQPIRDWDEDSALQALLVVEEVEDTPAGAAVAHPFTAAAAGARAPQQLPSPLPCVIWLARAGDRVFTLVSPSAKEMLGVDAEEWIQSPTAFADRINPADRPQILAFYERAFKSPGFHSSEFRLSAKPGYWFRETVLVQNNADLISGVITDVTARRVMEEQLLQSQRLEAASALAGRLAHDINNPLMIVNGYSEDLAQALPADDPMGADIREIQNAGKRIGELTAGLQAVTRKQALSAQEVDIAAELAKVVERMRAAAGEYLQAEFKAPDRPLTALAEAGQLEAVILELSAALVEGGGDSAHLILSAAPYQVTELVRADQALAPGYFVQLIIVNQSSGVPQLPVRLFESLVPARDGGRDNGPALAKAFKTVQEWGGTIQYSAESAAIRIFLGAPGPPPPPPSPRVEAAKPEPVRATKATRQEAPPAPERKTTVLVVEDEPGIRALMRKILQREGFEVFEAGNGPEAIALLKQSGPVNLLITDVMMPGMSGRQLAEQVQVMDPNCGILYMSGFTADTGVETGQFPPGSHFLQKPFTLGSLLRKANEVLAATPTSRTR